MGRMGFEQWHQLEQIVHDEQIQASGEASARRCAADFPGNIPAQQHSHVVQIGPSHDLL